MVKIERLGQVIRKLRNLARRHEKTSVKVGYTAQYAVYVHENLEANHPNGGQAKFLEQPAREMREELGAGVRRDMRAGMTLQQALLRAGLKLQAASQQLVPVDTGALRASAFTEVTKGKS